MAEPSRPTLRRRVLAALAALAPLLAAWGIATVRGSASRGAVGGFLRLVQAHRHGHNLAVLPDGPRGPRHVVKPGVVQLARTLRAPIYPMTYAADRARRLRSWDRLLIPAPFARIAILVGAPVTVPATAATEELEALRAEVERRLAAVTTAAEARPGMAASRAEPSPRPPQPSASDRPPP